MSTEASDIHKFQEDSGMTFEEVFRFAFGPIFTDALGALREELGADRFFDVIKSAVDRNRERQGRGMAESLGSNHLSALGAALGADPASGGVRNLDRFWGHVLTLESIEDSDTVIVTRATECLWAKTFRELGAADTGYALLCHGDYGYCRGFNPEIKLTRTKTLMQGDDCCDFRWELED